ncbi:MAG: FG-GAP-like repeat-containing protein [Chloroflexota bacterium]
MTSIQNWQGRRWLGAAVFVFLLVLLPLVLGTGTAGADEGRLQFISQQIGDPAAQYTGIHLADMDYDGLPEILIGNRGTNSVDIYHYEPIFRGMEMLDTVELSNDVHDIYAADFDNDGDIDIVAGLRFHGVRYVENTGAPGTVGNWNDKAVDPSYSWQVLVDDFDQDGKLDIINCADHGPIHTWYGNGQGAFSQGADIIDPATDMISPRGFTAIDLNGDSRLDLIGLDGRYLRAFLNPGNRQAAWLSVGPQTQYADMSTTQISSDLGHAAGDLNGDGYVDQVAMLGTPQAAGSLTLYLFVGGKTGSTLQWDRVTLDVLEHVGYGGAIGVADVDGDGRLDIHVSGGQWFDGFIVYFGDGLGNFEREDMRYTHGMGGFNSFAVGDLNADGGIDIVANRQPAGFDAFFAQVPSPDGFWTLECVDCRPYFGSSSGELTERSLQLDAQGKGHIAYGSNYLFYAVNEGEGWRNEVVDVAGGKYPSLALDAAGGAHISYMVLVNYEYRLRYASRTDSGWEIENVELGIDSIYQSVTSLALDSQGRPHIGYTADGRAKYAYKSGDGWLIEPVAADAGPVSLALGSDGRPHMSLTVSGLLEHAQRDEFGWHLSNVKSEQAGFSSLAMAGGDEPNIAYEQGGDIKFARLSEAWEIETVLEGGDYRSPSLVLGQADMPFIGYYEANSRSVGYINKSGSNWVHHSVAYGSVDGSGISLVLNSQQQGYVAYRANGNVMVNNETVAQGGYLGGISNSIKVDAMARPVISYQDYLQKDLLVARLGDGGWKIETVESMGDAGFVSVLALDGAGNAHVAYSGSGGQLKYARRTAAGWEREKIDDNGGGIFIGFDVDAGGKPHVVYNFYDPDGADTTYYAYRTAAGWQREILETGDQRGFYPSLAVDSQGRPHVAYNNYDQSLEEVIYAYRDAAGWHKEVIDSLDHPVVSASLAVADDDTPRIVYSWLSYPGGVMITYAYRDGSGWHKEFVANFPEPPELGGSEPLMALGPDGQPHITFGDQMALDYDYPRYGFRDETGWHFQNVPFASGGGAAPLAVDDTGRPWLLVGAVRVAKLNRVESVNPESVLNAGEYHTCALRPNGRVECWGANTAQEDHGQTAGRRGPFTQVGAGAIHSCGLKTDGSVECWGGNQYGQAESRPGPFTQLSVGGDHNCGLRADGSVECWGANERGQAESQPGPFAQIGTGFISSCGLQSNGRLVCWGDVSDRAKHTGPYTQLSVGWSHLCGLTAEGRADCWGDNGLGQAANANGPFIQISAGGQHTCGLKPDGSVDCWGANGDGQAEDQPGPYTRISAGGTLLSSAFGQTCGLKPNGDVDCWGNNTYGQADDRTGPFGLYDPAANRAPKALGQTVVTGLNTNLKVGLSASDADGDPLTFTIVKNPQHGTLAGTGPNRTYTPAAGYHGPDRFTFKANDGVADSNVATVSITVTAAPPVWKAFMPFVKR